MGEKSVGEKCMGDNSVGENYVDEKLVAKFSLVRSFWMKNTQVKSVCG